METEAGIYFLNILSAGDSLSWRYPVDPCKLSVFSVSRCLYLSHFAPHNVSSVSKDKTGLRSPQLSTLFKLFVLFKNYLIPWFSYNFRLFLPKLLSTAFFISRALVMNNPDNYPPPLWSDTISAPATTVREAERGVSPGSALFRYLLYLFLAIQGLQQ